MKARYYLKTLLSGNSVMLLPAASLHVEFDWNNYFQLTADFLFRDKENIISLIFFFGGGGAGGRGGWVESCMEAIITQAPGRDSRTESRKSYFLCCCSGNFLHVEKSRRQSSSQCCLPLLKHGEVSRTTCFTSWPF